MARMCQTTITVATLIALSAPVHAQLHEPSDPTGGPFSRKAVLDAPFSADAITSVRMPNGTKYTVTARYYRASDGRVRAELDTPWGPYVMLAIPGTPLPERVSFFHVEPDKRTYRLSGYFFAAILFNGEGRVALPVARICFQTPFPVAGGSDAERLRAVNARVAEDLGVVITSHRLDDTGSIDYELTNIRREEPPADLFDLSAYTFVEGPVDEPQMMLVPWQLPPACKSVAR